jgi:hypothetical protein
VGGMQVVQRAKSLGVFFGERGNSSVDWEGRLETVRRRMQNISRISKLSAFGRAFAANAYALSTILYAAQFAGQLPANVSEQLAGGRQRLLMLAWGLRMILGVPLASLGTVWLHILGVVGLAFCPFIIICCLAGLVKQSPSCRAVLHRG